MKLKTFVGIVLITTFFLVGNIFLFGLLENKTMPRNLFSDNDLIFMSLYFVLCVLILIALIVYLKDIFENKSDVVLLLFFGVIICFAIVFSAAGFKSYLETSKAANLYQTSVVSEIDNLYSANEYFLGYMDYYSKSMQIYKNNSLAAMKKIEEVKQAQADVLIPIIEYVQEPPIIQEEEIIYEAPNREYIEDDEEWDDD